jgi:glycosyltransferase involved in cell wall biosynthesis
LLLTQVDRFVLYHRNIDGYSRFYGIDQKRAYYIPFKVNGWEKRESWPNSSSDGEYVLCAGRTLRDTRTFVEAMRKSNRPGILLQQPAEVVLQHGTRPWDGDLPSNVSLVKDEEGTFESFARYISGARIVVIPRFHNDIAATGISTYLLAMALNRCVIISDGPAASDVLSDEAVIVPPGDIDALASAITTCWDDKALRTQIAERGYKYAQRLRGEERLLADVLELSLKSLPQVHT